MQNYSYDDEDNKHISEDEQDNAIVLENFENFVSEKQYTGFVDVSFENENEDPNQNLEQEELKKEEEVEKPPRKNSNLLDSHIFAIATQAKVILPKETHVLSLITEFVNLKEQAAPNIRFWISEKDHFYWVNKTND